MKTLVLYATKYGAAKEIAESIAEKTNGIAYDVKQGGIPSLSDFDCVIAGSSIYAGMIHRGMKDFIAQNAAALKEKRLGLFIVGLDGKSEKEYFGSSNFPEDVVKAAKAARLLGGVFDPGKANFLEKLVMRLILKQAGRVDKTDSGKIDDFVEEIMS